MHMRIARTIAVGLFTFICVAAVSLLVYLGTLQMTVLDRSVVKDWLVTGGVYEKNLVAELIQTGAEKPTVQNVDTKQFEIEPQTLRTALEKTFPPEYTQKHAEKIIDNFYDWLDGESPSFGFTIPVNEKKESFIKELTKAAEPQIAALPVCDSTQSADTLCRPAKIRPDVYSELIITEKINRAGFFNEPIEFSEDSGDSSMQKLPTDLPKTASAIEPMIIILAILAPLSAALAIWLSAPDKRLWRLGEIFKRIFGSQIFVLVLVILAIIAVQAGWFKFSSLTPASSSNISASIGDVLKAAFISVTSTFVILSSIVSVASLGGWLGIFFWRRKMKHATVLAEAEASPPEDKSSTETSSIKPPETPPETSKDPSNEPPKELESLKQTDEVNSARSDKEETRQ